VHLHEFESMIENISVNFYFCISILKNPHTRLTDRAVKMGRTIGLTH
jgi:hypothetical protein